MKKILRINASHSPKMVMSLPSDATLLGVQTFGMSLLFDFLVETDSEAKIYFFISCEVGRQTNQHAHNCVGRVTVNYTDYYLFRSVE